MPALKKRQFMADITVCDRHVITASVTVFGNGLPRLDAKKTAIGELEKARGNGNGGFACLRENAGVYYDGKIVYSDVRRSGDFGTKVHEEFHAMVAGLKIPSVGAWTNPLEESAAYAYEDNVLSRRYNETEILKRLLVNSLLAKYSVRFLVGTDNSGLDKMRANAIWVLNRTAGMIIGDATAVAFSCVENFMLYLECLAVLDKFGAETGKQVLFDAMRLCGHSGPENARQFLLARVDRNIRDRIEATYGIDPSMLRLRPIHHHDYKEEERILQ
ncbi:MAG: hypothetical protein AABW86_04315 [Candidatus Micrarchaeota archaeon]